MISPTPSIISRMPNTNGTANACAASLTHQTLHRRARWLLQCNRNNAIDPKGGIFPIIGDRRITRLDCGRGALMLDNPEKTARLLAALKAAVPFKVELVPSLVTYLRTQHVAIADQSQHIVSNLSYAGDEGGIVCHIAPPDKEEALVVSLTQVRVPRSMPLAAAVTDYHNHRVKKLKKQRMAQVGRVAEMKN